MVVWPSFLREGNIGTWRPGAGARILTGTARNETPETGTQETVMEEKEKTWRTWRPGAGVGILSGTVWNETSGRDDTCWR